MTTETYQQAAEQLLQKGTSTQQEALDVFDTLDPVDLDFMIGRWQGSGLQTGHPMDGLLELSGWYGKEFIDPETVHPLLFNDGQGKIFKVAPNPTAMNWMLKVSLPQQDALKPFLTGFLLLLKTEESQARLRMMEYRGKVSATMIYDYLPINDAFRKIDENRVLGIMDYKMSSQPFFFSLQRVI
ncbi:MAG: DUF4334 domain-containing protein [Microcystaceae cyanobacterium]